MKDDSLTLKEVGVYVAQFDQRAAAMIALPIYFRGKRLFVFLVNCRLE